MVSSALSFHNPFVNGGRSYGTSASVLMMPMLPVESTSRMPLTAESAVIPPPMIRYLYFGIFRLEVGCRGLFGKSAGFIVSRHAIGCGDKTPCAIRAMWKFLYLHVNLRHTTRIGGPFR